MNAPAKKKRAWFPGMDGAVFTRGSVQPSEELDRIVGLPRRQLVDTFTAQQAIAFSQALKKPQGRMMLRPIQGAALHDIAQVGGLLGLIGVGHGKTLISLLAPRILGAQRPLIVIPASLKEKTFDDMASLSQDWYLPPYIRVESYEFLSRVRGADLLAQYKPDVIVCDEAHRLKNPSAAVTKRMRRYIMDTFEKHEQHPASNPRTKFVAMSGTMSKRSIQDYAHLAAWALGDMSPLPRAFHVLMEWGAAIDESTGFGANANGLAPGALEQLATDEPVDDQASVRRAFRARLVETPGVVATTEGALATSLEIDAKVIEPSAEVVEAMTRLRLTWTLPDGHEMIDGVERWRHARELALGFYYKWDPWPPEEWMIPRSTWFSSMRQVLKNNRRHIDTDKQLRNAMERNPEWYPDAAEAYEGWLEVKDNFKPKTIAVWLSDHVIHEAHQWAKTNNGIVWVEHQAFGTRFEQITGIPCYGESGLDSRGNRIEHHPVGTPMCARIASNCTGRNLQAWHQNLIVSPPPGGLQTEQMLGRTHRPGQLADTVFAKWLFSCAEHFDAWDKCIGDSEYVVDSQGNSRKILYADTTFTVNQLRAGRTGPVWEK